MENENENEMQFGNANEDELTQLQIEKDLLEQRVLELEEESKTKVQIAKQEAERKKGLAIKNARSNNSFNKEELIQDLKESLSQEFGLGELRQERIKGQIKANLDDILASKPEYKKVVNADAITKYVSGTGATVEEAIDALYSNHTVVTEEKSSPLDNTGGSRVDMSDKEDISQLTGEELAKYLAKRRS